MTRGKFLVGVVAAAFAVSATPALAQRSASGGTPTGTAVSRGDSGGGSSSGGGGSSVSSGRSSGDSSSGSASTPSTTGPSGYVTVPSHPSERQRRAGGGDRSSGSGSSAGRAVPRGGSDVAAPGSGGRTTSSTRSEPSPSERAVPTYSRPRDGRPATGHAVERRYPPQTGEYPIYYYYPRYGSYYWPGYAFGLGYYYSPYFYDPYYYGGLGFYGGGYGGGYGGTDLYGSGSGSYDRVGTGSVRLKVKPRDAQVYVDGYYVGLVDEFDGLFQKLTLDAGPRRIEIRADGYESSTIEVTIIPGETVTYEGNLKAIQ